MPEDIIKNKPLGLSLVTIAKSEHFKLSKSFPKSCGPGETGSYQGTARYETECSICGGKINPGDPLAVMPGRPEGQRGVHPQCADGAPVSHQGIDQFYWPPPSPGPAKPDLRAQLRQAQKALPNGLENLPEKHHERFPMLVYLIQKRHHAYLWGPPGSGKSHAAGQAAEYLGMPFGYISLNPQTPESRLLGYRDATGLYRSTVFRDLYQGGGIFCIDELDNAAPALLTTLNGCLEQSLASFPDGMVDRHPDFVCVSTGNTNGRGANVMHPDRRPFDAAFAERFSFLQWPYDEALELRLALEINPGAEWWVQWVRTVRAYVTAHNIRLTVSPRASMRGAAYLQDGTWNCIQIADAVVFKGTDEETIYKILQAVGAPERQEESL